MTEPSSLRGRLLTRLLIPMLGLFAFSAALAYYAAFRFANQVYDRTIEDTAIALSQLTIPTASGAALDLPPQARHMLASDQRDRVYYALIHADGAFIAGHRGLPSPSSAPPPGAPPECADAIFNGEAVRVASYRHPILPVVVQVAETVTKRDVLAFEIIAGMLLPLVLLGILGTAGIWLGVAQGLHPLTRLAEQLRDRPAHDLGPLEESATPREVQPLVQALNGLLARVETLLSSQQRFVADAAHQLRTPIAGIKTQAETALRAADIASMRTIVGNIVTGATRMASLVVQLLALARASSEAAAGASLKPLDLEALARGVTTDWVARAIEHGIDLGYASERTTCNIHGDAVMLRELLGNLIDNALKHCPPGSEATVSVDADGSWARLSVVDNGPGIPLAERDRVLERFYRGADSSVPGTGLGLPIVQEIVRMHGASLSIDDGAAGRGTRVSVRFDRPNGIESSGREAT